MESSVVAGERGQALVAEAVAFLQRLIQLRTDTPDGYPAAAAVVGELLDDLGFAVERHDVESPEGFPVPTILGWAGPRVADPLLVLNAHLDTNPAGDGWTVPPYDGIREGGRIFGRGAVIAKSDVAAYIFGAAAACQTVPSPSGSVLVAITCDEGAGGALGPGYILTQLGIAPRRAMTPGFTPVVGVAHNGAVQGAITVYGTASHQAALDPERDAMQHAVRIAHAIGERDAVLRHERSTTTGIAHPTFNVTRFRAGSSFGMAPGLAELLFDRRVTPDENLAEAERDVRAVVEGVPHGSGVTVDLSILASVEPLRPSEAQSTWALLVREEAEDVLGHHVPAGGIPIYTDARIFADAGIPTVLFGAGQPDLTAAGINGVDESVSVSDVEHTVEIVARVVARVLDPVR